MSHLAPFFVPESSAHALVRARFRRLAQRFETAAVRWGDEPGAAELGAAWLPQLAQSHSVDELTPAWRQQLDARAAGLSTDPWLTGSAVAGVLTALENDLSDPDYLTAWESLRAVRHRLALTRAARLSRPDLAAVAADTHATVVSLYGAGDTMDLNLDFEALRTGLVAFLERWFTSLTTEPGPVGELSGLLAFHDCLATKVRAPASCWQLILYKLETAFPAEFAELWPVLAAAVPRNEFAQHLGTALAETRLRETRPALTELALVAFWLGAAPDSALARRALPMLAPSAVLAAVRAAGPAWTQARAALLAQLGRTVELAQLDYLNEALAWIDRLADTAAALLSHAAPFEQQLALRLAAEPDAPRHAALGAEIFARALQLDASSLAPGLAPGAFRRYLVANCGCDGASPADQAALGLVRFAAAIVKNGDWPERFRGARTLLRGVETSAPELAKYPLARSREAVRSGWQPPVTVPAELRPRCQRDLAFAVQRLAVELRLAPPATARRLFFQWHAAEVAPHLKYLPGPELAVFWSDLAALPALPPAVAEALRGLVETTPRFTAALKLARTHADLGAAIARSTFYRLPEYAARLGDKGLASCARDNSLTLRTLARIIVSGVDSPAEELAVWWNAVVGAYINNRPPHLFETNLRSIHAALQSSLAPAEVDEAFAIVHQVYKESLGITDSPLHYFSEFIAPDAPAEEAAATGDTWIQRAARRAGQEPGFDWTAWLRTVARAPAPKRAAWIYLQPTLPEFTPAFTPVHFARGLAAVTAEAASATPAEAARWTHFCRASAALATQQTLAGALLQPWGSASAEALAGGGSAFDKCRRDLGLFNEFLARQLRLRDSDLAAVNTLRFLTEAVLPHVSYSGETWREIFTNWSRDHGARLRGPERLVLDQWTALLSAAVPRLVEWQALLHASFPAGSYVHSSNTAREKRLRALFSTILVRESCLDVPGWSGDTLYRAAVTALGLTDEERPDLFAALVQHIDKLFGQVDESLYYRLLEILPICEKLVPLESAVPSSDPDWEKWIAAIAVAAPPPGLLRRAAALVGRGREEAIADDLWRAAALWAGTAAAVGTHRDRFAVSVLELSIAAPAGATDRWQTHGTALSKTPAGVPWQADATQLLALLSDRPHS